MISTISLCLEPMHLTKAKHRFLFKLLSSSPEVQKVFLTQKAFVKVCPILKGGNIFMLSVFRSSRERSDLNEQIKLRTSHLRIRNCFSNGPKEKKTTLSK